jgi:hypothetical protein
MSRKFLTNIDLNSNELRNGVIHNLATDPLTGAAGQLYFNTVDQVLKFYNGTTSQWEAVGSIEAIGDAVSDLLESGTGISLSYDDEEGTLTIENTGVTSVAGTENEVSVSASAGAVTISLPESITVDVTGDLTGNADTATALETSRTISLGGSLSGSVSFDGSSDVTITADIVADAVALGSDTTGDYVASVSGSGDGISVTGTGEGASVTIENTGVTSVSGTANQVTVSASTGLVTIGLPDDVTIGGDLIVTGDLTVSGSVTTLNTETLLVEDNQITLNSNVTGVPAANAGLEVERGDSTNASLIWNESSDKWSAGLLGSETAISLEGHVHATSDITGLQEYVEDTVGTMLTDSSTVDFTYSDNSGSAGTFTAGIITASTSYLTTGSGLAVDISSVESKLITDGFPKKYAVNNTSLTSTSGVCTWTVTHNLATKDVTVQVYEVAADYNQVEVDVQHTSTSAITIKINSATTIAADTYRVVVIG